MNPADVRFLYEYVIESRGKFLSKCRELGWDEFTKNREASWNSMQGIFVHMLEMEDSWLHYDIPGKPWPYGDRDPAFYKSFEEMEAFHRQLADKTRALLKDLTRDALAKEVVFEYRKGMAKSTIESILVHAFIDEVAHLGELICLMWQLNVKPPYLSYIDQHIKSM